MLWGSLVRMCFFNQDAPRYLPALVTTAAFGGVGALVVAAALGVWMWWDNGRRDGRLGRRLGVGGGDGGVEGWARGGEFEVGFVDCLWWFR